MKSPFPFVAVNVAMSADGKIAPANRKYVPFTTKVDRDRMMVLRTRVDAVMSGASTVMAGPVDLGPGTAEYRKKRLEQKLSEYNLRIVVSGSANLDPKAHIFSKRFSPIIVLVTELAPPSKVNALAAVADEIYIAGHSEIDWSKTLAWLKEKWKVKALLCEGGGEVNAGLFRADLVDKLYLTIAPLILGGKEAPTLADGFGAGTLAEGKELTLKKLEKIGNELYLVYKLKKRSH